MKRIPLLFALTMIVQAAFSQVVIVNYMQVPEGGEDAFMKVRKKIQIIQQERVKKQDIHAWYLLKVEGANAESDYQFVTLYVYKDQEQRENSQGIGHYAQVLGDDYDLEKLGEEASSTRKIIHRDVLELRTNAGPLFEGNLLYIFFMKAEDPEKYFKMEKVAYKPRWKTAIEMGGMEGWSIWSLQSTKGDLDFNGMAVNGFNSKEQGESLNWDEVKKASLKGKSEEEVQEINQYSEKDAEIRTTVRLENWIRKLSAIHEKK